jgi:alkaline phosphatase D
MNPAPHISRRHFLESTAVLALGLPLASRAAQSGPQQALGVRAGEVSDSTAIVWTRLTQSAERNANGVKFTSKAKGRGNPPQEPPADLSQIEGACPGVFGRVRLRYGMAEDLGDAVATPWVDVTEVTDFSHQFPLTGLKPGSVYFYASEAAASGDTVTSTVRGRFYTAPLATERKPVKWCVMTCQGYHDRDHADGHPIYPSMSALAPEFIVMTGDLVYYDNDPPEATSTAIARVHWERMFSLPRIKATLAGTSTYWLKDDHDVLSDDAWPGKEHGALTFSEGLRIFREQTPVGKVPYRTFRWGRDLQIWFTEGRDFRSPNKLPDGPEKTIWGTEQKEWFKRTVAESDATWKLLISPTALVGPDRAGKADNHANKTFQHEGDELRKWIKANVPEHFFVICGDRHWQYHSVHPTSGVQEFSVGAASDSHAGGTPGLDPEYHRFHRVKGGFLSGEVRSEGNESVLVLQLRDVDGAVVYEMAQRRKM